MRNLILFLLLVLPLLALAQETHFDSDQGGNETQTDKEWVIVLDDPRPARLQGWTRGGYSNNEQYRGALELERFGKKVASKYDMKLHDQWFIPSLGVYCLVVGFNTDELETIAKLKKDKAVQWVQPSSNFELLDESRRPTIKERQNNSSNLDAKLPSMINGEGVIIAIVDSAVDQSHQDLVGGITESGDFVIAGQPAGNGESHGTAIAGVVITDVDTKLGVAGIAPAATVHAYRGCWESAEPDKTNCNTLSLARALDAVVRSGADILNLSLSGPKDALLDRLLQRIIDDGSIVVAAFDPMRANTSRFPTQRKGVLIVRARGLDDHYNNVFTAPGARVVPVPGNRYDFMQGHSVATAYTSGILALRKQALNFNLKSSDKENDWRNTSQSTMAEDLVSEFL